MDRVGGHMTHPHDVQFKVAPNGEVKGAWGPCASFPRCGGRTGHESRKREGGCTMAHNVRTFLSMVAGKALTWTCPLNLGSSHHSKSGSGESTGPKARVNLQGPVWGSPLFPELDLPLKHSTATPRGRAFKHRNRGREDRSHSQVCICLCACTCACM